jgi:hypothetical protein
MGRASGTLTIQASLGMATHSSTGITRAVDLVQSELGRLTGAAEH